MKTRTKSFWLLLFMQCLSISIIAQWAGGSGNGRSPSAEVSAASINAGGVSGDVNLFTGTFSSSYELGTVTTVSGISYTATLSHNSSFASGDNLPHSTGIPYGEGWTLGLPTISINTEDFAKYSIAQKTSIINQTPIQGNPDPFDPPPTQIYYEEGNCEAAKEEGLLYAYMPELSIPGYASGRLIFKKQEGEDFVFVLNVFERYVEARLKDGAWTVIMDDGTIFHIDKRVIAHRNPSNQRVQDQCHTKEVLANLYLPKTEYLSWYCTTIRHPLKTGKINFDYDDYGCFDYFKVYNQYRNNISDYFFGVPNGQELAQTCKDIFINKIHSGTNELLFNYEFTETPTPGVNLPDEETLTKDNLYSQMIVNTYEGEAFNGEGWHRYHHLKSKNLGLSCGQKFDLNNPLNPYESRNSTSSIYGTENHYVRQEVENTTSGIPFNHGYLESGRIGASLPAGDIYEVKTTIKNNAGDQCLFDINLATGDGRYPEEYVSFGNEGLGNTRILASCYKTRNGSSVYSTFNRAFKWASAGNTSYDLETSDFFVMPNRPPQYQGFHIQIGPANSDNNFSRPPEKMTYGAFTSIPDPCRSYLNLNPGYGPDPNGEPANAILTSAASIPQNFGIGMPWYSMLDFYQSQRGIDHCNNNRFWWNHTPDSNTSCGDNTFCGTPYSWNNEPTAAPYCQENGGILLNHVQLIRYAKRPYMLSSVEYKEQTVSGVSVLIQKRSFTYDLRVVDRFTGATVGNSTEVLSFNRQPKRNIFLLKTIAQEPVDVGVVESLPTTHFDYEEAQTMNLFGLTCGSSSSFHNTNLVVLSKITDPLGKETIIKYHAFSGVEEVSPLGLNLPNTDSYSLSSFRYQYRPGEINQIPGFNFNSCSYNDWLCGHNDPIKPAPSYAYQTYAVVKEKRIRDHASIGEKVWTYTYKNLVVKGDQIQFEDNLQYDKRFSRTGGYSRTTVTGPSSGGQAAPVMTVRHYTDNLKWGKVKGIINEDATGEVVNKTLSTYETVLVHDGTSDSGNTQTHPDFVPVAGMYDVPRFYESRNWPGEIRPEHYRNSYFLKKIQDDETIYDGGKSMTTTTTYDYFDADYNGVTSSGGFEAMGITIPINFEPSFQLYKKRTTYSGLSGTSTQEEYFYLFDLINDPNHQVANQPNILSKVYDNWKTRNLSFEKRTTTDVQLEAPVTHSQYTIYSDSWPGSPLNNRLYVKEIAQKVEPASGEILSFEPGTVMPVFPYETQVVNTINKRNENTQVLSSTDERGLESTFTYNDIGLLESSIIGNGLNGEQTTQIVYNSNNTIREIIDPNGTKLKYGYDPFLRMDRMRRNNDVLQEIKYNYWKNDKSLNFEERATQNYIETTNFVSNSSDWYERAYVDPLGRPVAKVKEGVLLENNVYDINNRVVTQLKPQAGTQPIYGIGVNDPTHINIKYDRAPRNRPLKSAKYGEALNGGHTVNSGYEIVSKTQVFPVLSAAGQIVQPLGTRFFKTTTIDEDGKETVEYKNQLGQVVLTVGKNGETATVFYYDSQGNITKIHNPLNQFNQYKYNFLGQLYESTTVDDGTTRFGYNSSGQLVAQHFANNQIRLYQFDAFKRPIVQANAQMVGSLLDNNGMAWVVDNQFEITLNNLINSASAVFEKEFFYDTFDPAQSTSYPSNAIHYLQNSLTNTIGRLVQTTSYNLDGKPIENRWHSYLNNGFLKWEMMQFKEPSTNDDGRLVRIDYQDYNRQGSFETQNIDLNGDGTLDFQYRYEYDNWNRLIEVYANYFSPINNGYKIASYDYDNIFGSLKKKSYYDSEKWQCKNKLVDEVEYFYDDRIRLTDITSHLFDWKLYYDDNMDVQHPGNFEANYNGNINTSRGIYKQENTVNPELLLMTGPSIYNYKYDELNRLINADIKIEQITDTPNVIPCGDVNYTYDKLGNMSELRRCSDGFMVPFPEYLYEYSPGTNQLNKVTDENGSEFLYTYDGSGNLKTDSKKGITSMIYGRAKLPWQIQKQTNGTTQDIDYGYNVTDQRIFKHVSTAGNSLSKEYYIRSANGQELAVFDITNNDLVWYVHGTERVAKIEHESNLNFTAIAANTSLLCNNNPPACSPQEQAEQEDSYAVLQQNWITNPNNLNLPTNLYRIRLCNGSEIHVLDQELMYLTGSYLTLQTININSTFDLFFYTNNPQLLPQLVTLSGLLTIRFQNVLINGFKPCETPNDPYDGDLINAEVSAVPNPSFYIYDHLGNTRVVYSTEIDCGEPVVYTSENMIDYFPYGKILRKKSSAEEKYLTTGHERDVETGLDYRGARFYDSDVVRFLSLDPKALDFASWSPYNYVLGNPVSLIDPDGKAPTGPGPNPGGIIKNWFNSLFNNFTNSNIRRGGRLAQTKPLRKISGAEFTRGTGEVMETIGDYGSILFIGVAFFTGGTTLPVAVFFDRVSNVGVVMQLSVDAYEISNGEGDIGKAVEKIVIEGSSMVLTKSSEKLLNSSKTLTKKYVDKKTGKKTGKTNADYIQGLIEVETTLLENAVQDYLDKQKAPTEACEDECQE